MNKSNTVDVYVKLPHGLIIGAVDSGIPGFAMDSARLFLQHGFNDNVDRECIEAWMAKNKTLACVKRGDVRIIDGDRIARDSSNRK
jgi:hypothetical protein